MIWNEYLVSPTDHLDVVGGVELGDHVWAEEVASPSRWHAPTLVILRVGPQQVAHGPVVRHLAEQKIWIPAHIGTKHNRLQSS